MLPCSVPVDISYSYSWCMCYQCLSFVVTGLQRLSNLRIHDNFNSNLCQKVAKTCVRVGAIDSGTPNFAFTLRVSYAFVFMVPIEGTNAVLFGCRKEGFVET